MVAAKNRVREFIIYHPWIMALFLLAIMFFLFVACIFLIRVTEESLERQEPKRRIDAAFSCKEDARRFQEKMIRDGCTAWINPKDGRYVVSTER